MYSRISRYLATNFILPFIVSNLFFETFLLTFQLLRITRLVVSKGVQITLILKLLLNISITFLPITIPLSLLFSAVYTLNKLCSDSEWIAMRSLGLSLFRLYRPFFFVSVSIGAFLFCLSYKFIPYSETSFKEIVAHLSTKGALTDIKQGQFFTEIPGLTIWAKNVSDRGKDLEEVFIHSTGNEERIILAQRGLINYEQQGESLAFKLHLIHGNLIKKASKGALEKVVFEDYLFPLNNQDLKISIPTKDSMRSLPELYKLIKMVPAERQKWVSDVDFKRTQLEFWSRFNNALICVIFTALGFSLGVQKTRGKIQNSVSVCLGLLVCYYAFLFGGISFARVGDFPPVVAIFAPTILIALLLPFFYRRLQWT